MISLSDSCPAARNADILDGVTFGDSREKKRVKEEENKNKCFKNMLWVIFEEIFFWKAKNRTVLLEMKIYLLEKFISFHLLCGLQMKSGGLPVFAQNL